MANKKRYISTSPKAMTAKLGKVEIYNKGPPSIRSFDVSSTWSSDHVTDKNVIFLLPRELWLGNLTECWVLMRAYYSQSHITCWSRRCKSHKTYEKRFHVTYGYQTWQKGGLWVGFTCLTTMRLRGITWQMNFIIYLFYEAYCH